MSSTDDQKPPANQPDSSADPADSSTADPAESSTTLGSGKKKNQRYPSKTCKYAGVTFRESRSSGACPFIGNDEILNVLTCVIFISILPWPWCIPTPAIIHPHPHTNDAKTAT